MKKALSVIMALTMILSAAMGLIAVSGRYDSEPVLRSITEYVSSDGGLINISYDGFCSEEKSVLCNGKEDLVTADVTELPSSYDSRSLGIVTSVKNQYPTGACWAFSTMSVLETDALKSGLLDTATDFSSTHLAWFTYNPSTDSSSQNYGEYYYPQSNKTAYTYGGNYLRATSTLFQFIGMNKESTYPHTTTSEYNYSESDRFVNDTGLVLKDTAVLNGLDQETSSADVIEIKKWIMEHGSVMAGYYTDSSTTYENRSTGATYCEINAGGTNHAITIVGWDDNYSKSNFKQGTYTYKGVTYSYTPTNNGAWLVKNSWGTYNKNDGYIWISYEDANLMGSTTKFVGMTAQKNTYKYRYSYNSVGYSQYYPFNSGKTAKQANVFTGSADGNNVTAVTCYTMGENVQATVKIYKNISSGYTNPTQGTLALEYTESLRYSGYHTIKLPQSVSIQQGEIFSVVIEYTSNSGTFAVPVEGSGKQYDSISNSDLQSGATAGYTQYTSSARQSYFMNGSNWSDTVTDLNLGNVYIQALSDHSHHYVSGFLEGKTCQDKNKNATYCDICGDISSSTDAEGYGPHSYQYQSKTEPTCQSGGYTTYKCKWCTDSYNSDFTSSVNHNCQVLSVTEPTCKQGGYTTYKCKWCTYQYDANQTTTVDHKCSEYSVTLPKCEEQGYTTYKCQWCEYTYNGTPTQATGHELIKGELVSEDGTYFVYKYKCKNCDHTENQKIEKTFFQKVAYAFSSFFKSIGSFFKGIFS